MADCSSPPFAFVVAVRLLLLGAGLMAGWLLKEVWAEWRDG